MIRKSHLLVLTKEILHKTQSILKAKTLRIEHLEPIWLEHLPLKHPLISTKSFSFGHVALVRMKMEK
jgi:hypothetical protein